MTFSISDRRERSGEVHAVGERIRSFLAASGLERGYLEQRVLALFPDVAARRLGAEAAGAVRAEAIEHGVLRVRVQHGGWRHRLLFEREALAGALNEAVRRKVVRSIRIV